MPHPKNRLDLPTRKEITNEVWRIFTLIASSINLSFDQDGITIRISFKERHTLDGPPVIYAKAFGYNEYEEREVEGYSK